MLVAERLDDTLFPFELRRQDLWSAKFVAFPLRRPGRTRPAGSSTRRSTLAKGRGAGAGDERRGGDGR